MPWHDFGLDDNAVETYCQLDDTASDLMLEADLARDVLNCYHCGENSDPDNIKIFSSADYPLERNVPILLRFSPHPDDGINPINLYAEVVDNLLCFGFCVNEMSCFTRSASLDVNFGRLGQNATPGEVSRIIKNAFVLN